MQVPPDSPPSPSPQPAESHADRETEALAERFFSQPPQAWELEPGEGWRPAPLTKNERLAMLATVAPVAIGAAVAIGLFVFSEPLFASAEPNTAPSAKAARATAVEAPRAPQHDATQHGRTALVRAAAQQSAPLEPNAAAMPPAVTPVLAEPATPVIVTAKLSEPSTNTNTAVAATASIVPTRPAAGPTPARLGATPVPTPARAAARASGSALERARRALDAGNPLEARTLATEAIGQDASAAAGYIVLAGALDALGDRAGMQATFRSCAERATDALASACRSLSR